jgi:hypothetical protein
MTEHTPLPWEVRPYVAGGWPIHAKQGPVTVCPAIAHGEADASFIVEACNMHAELVAALDALVNAKALSGVREQVAGWNGEHLPDDKRYGAHPSKLGATLPKTNCGAVYELDDAMVAAHAILAKAREATP